MAVVPVPDLHPPRASRKTTSRGMSDDELSSTNPSVQWGEREWIDAFNRDEDLFNRILAGIGKAPRRAWDPLPKPTPVIGTALGGVFAKAWSPDTYRTWLGGLDGEARGVLAGMLRGGSNARIAAETNLSEEDVRRHVGQLLAPWGFPPRVSFAVLTLTFAPDAPELPERNLARPTARLESLHRRVLDLIAEGKSTRDVAGALQTTPEQVVATAQQAFGSLGVDNPVSATLRYLPLEAAGRLEPLPGRQGLGLPRPAAVPDPVATPRRFGDVRSLVASGATPAVAGR